MKFQDKFYDIFDHNKCPPSEIEDENCIFRKSYFHRIQPTHEALLNIYRVHEFPLTQEQEQEMSC